VDIRGWTITDEKSDTHVIDPGAPLVIPPGGMVVLAVSADPAINGGVTPDYTTKGVSLGNTTDKLVLKFAGAEVDRVEWTIPPFPNLNGASMQLDALSLHAAMNDAPTAWCASSSTYGAGDKGTPGHPNAACGPVAPSCGNGVIEAGEQCDDGNTKGGDGCGPGCAVEGPAPEQGAVVITELMPNPKSVGDTDGEWFEVANTTDAPVDLNGWTIGDGGSEKHVIANGGPLIVPVGGRLVLGRNAAMATNGGVPVDYQYASVNLTNTSDTLRIEAGGVVVDQVTYGAGFPIGDGASTSLDPAKTSAAENDASSAWCLGKTTFGAGDKGTPGAANPSCTGP
jgi:cysteine-rich repeat protein